MNQFAHSKKIKPRTKRGFALVLSLALISFVFLLVITLVSQVRQDMAYSDARENLILAKANARMGMMIAIGEIQKHLGPDMRISATADIYDERIEGSEQADLFEDVAINEVPDGQRMWTGVWKNRGVGSQKNLKDQRSTNPLPFNGDDAISLTDSWEYDASYDHHPAIEMSWLVSGNEGAKLGIFDPISGKVVEHIEVPDGKPVTDEQTRLLPVNAGYEYGKKDNAWRDHLNVVETKLSNYYHPLLPLPNPDENETMAWVLKSPFGTEGDLLNKNGVKVPKTPLFLKGPQDWDQRQGAYAYWVGDEGVKAKIDFNQSFPLTDQSKIKVAPSPNLGGGSFELSSIEAKLGKLILSGSLPLLGKDEGEQENLNEFLANHYHSVTTHSFGVLSDLRTGGLKRDLSLAFAQFAPGKSKSFAIQNDFDDNFIFRERIIYKKNVPLYGEDANYRNVWKLGSESLIEDDDTLLAGPRWSVLADFHNFYRKMPSTLEMTIPDQFPRIIGDNSVIFEGLPKSPGKVFDRTNVSNYYFNSWDDSKRAHRPEPKNHALLPVVTKLRLGVCPVMKPNPAPENVCLAVLPSVTLWNPYDKPLMLKDVFIEIPPYWDAARGGEDPDDGFTHSIGFSIHNQDFKQFDLFRKWWVALYERDEASFRNELWDDFKTRLTWDPGLGGSDNRASYPAISLGYVRPSYFLKLSPHSIYGGVTSNYDTRSVIPYIIDNFIDDPNISSKEWREGKPLSSLVYRNIRWNDEEKTLHYFHENSDVTEDNASKRIDFIPEFVFHGLEHTYWRTVKDIRLKIVNKDYNSTVVTLSPGEIATFATFRSPVSPLLNEDFSDHIARLVIPVSKGSDETTERGFLLETDKFLTTGLVQVEAQLPGVRPLLEHSVESFQYNRSLKNFSYKEPDLRRFDGVRCITMFSGDAEKAFKYSDQNSPKVLTRYTNWRSEGLPTKKLETSIEFLRENYDFLGKGDPTNPDDPDQNQTGWGWEISVRLPGDHDNSQVLLNDFNFRSLVHSYQHGKKNWFNSTTKHYNPPLNAYTKAFAQELTKVTVPVPWGPTGHVSQLKEVTGISFEGKNFSFVDPWKVYTSSWAGAGDRGEKFENNGAFGFQGNGSEFVPNYYSLKNFNSNNGYDPKDLKNLGKEWHDSWNQKGLTSDQRAELMGLEIDYSLHLGGDRFEFTDSAQEGFLDAYQNPSLLSRVLTAASMDTESVGFFNNIFQDKRKKTSSPYNNYFRDSSVAVLFQTPQIKPLSLIEYRHANLNNYLHGPNYAFGSSYSSLQVARHRTWARLNHVTEEPTNKYGMGHMLKNKSVELAAQRWYREYYKNIFGSSFWDEKMSDALDSMVGKGKAFSHPPHHSKSADFLDWESIDANEGYGAWRSASGTFSHQNICYDQSYYLNRALMDGYFLTGSTDYNDSRSMKFISLGERFYPFVWDGNSSRADPPVYLSQKNAYGNTRLIGYLRNGEWNSTSYGSLQKGITNSSQNDTALRYQTVAGDLLVEGAFNINSTSVDAWIAHLSSLRGIELENGNVALNETPVIRFTAEPNANNWNELRLLSDEEIRKLAEAIVRQVKLRGPFLSFADFVNRRLCPGPRKPGGSSVRNFNKLDLNKGQWIPEDRDDSLPGLRGAIQEAIAQSGINDANSKRSKLWPLNEGKKIPTIAEYRWDTEEKKFYDSSFGLIALSKQQNITPLNSDIKRQWGLGETEFIKTYNVRNVMGDNKPSRTVDHRIQYPGANFGDAQENILAIESTATGACKPGWVLQSDILAPLAPSMTARSDTFVIRVMGETNQKNAAKTWIEVVVQRTPDYVKPDFDAPHHRPHEPFMDQNLNGYWDEATDEPWTNLNYNLIEYPDLPGDKNSNYRDGMPSDLPLVLDGQEEDINSLKGISIFGINQRFGRKFRIVNFRWLREQDV